MSKKKLKVEIINKEIICEYFINENVFYEKFYDNWGVFLEFTIDFFDSEYEQDEFNENKLVQWEKKK